MPLTQPPHPANAPPAHALGALIRRRCQQRGMTLSSLAQAAGITRAYLHRLLLGNTPNPGVLTLQRLAAALALPPMTLFRLYATADCPVNSTARRHEGLHDRQDALVFVADVTVPDYTLVLPNEAFTKTWAIQNAGQRSWVGRRLVRLGDELVMYRKAANNSLVPVGEAQLSTLGNSVDVPLTRPGQVVELSVDMRAPPGSCTVASHWQMVDADNQPCFGPECYLYTVVTVVGV